MFLFFGRRPASPGQWGSDVVSGLILSLFALVLLGAPRRPNHGNAVDGTLRQLDTLYAQQRFADALPIALALQEQETRNALVHRQVARAYAGLGRVSDEVAAWERFLQYSNASGDACSRLVELRRILPGVTVAAPILARCDRAVTEHERPRP